MKLRSFGCSFIFGTDLSDYQSNGLYPVASQRTWPALLARDLGLQYHCRAHGGSGNLAALDRLLRDIGEHAPFFACVGWTYVDRFDYQDPEGGPTGSNDWLALRPGDGDLMAQDYYRVLHSEYRDKLTALICVKTAVDALHAAKCPFIMTYMDHILMDSQFHSTAGTLALQKEIGPSLSQFDGQDFLAWARDCGHQISASGHPLDSAHADAARYLLPTAQQRLGQINPR